ncbi:MAG: hypothetical protein ACR2LC_00935 [Pyrinomonadaceae bacterium]
MRRNNRAPVSEWAAIGTRLTFRAEVMPGRESGERTFTVARVHASGRVELIEIFGQHAETEFEPVR